MAEVIDTAALREVFTCDPLDTAAVRECDRTILALCDALDEGLLEVDNLKNHLEIAEARITVALAACDARDSSVRASGVPGSAAIESMIAAGGAEISTVDIRRALTGSNA